MQVPIGANGWILLREPASLRPRPGIVTFTASFALFPSLSLRILQIQGFVMLRDPCLFLRKSHVVSENFGGISMDLSDMDVGTVQSP